MSRRPSRRIGDDGSVPFVSSLQSKTRSSPWVSIGLVVVGAILIIGYVYTSGSGGSSGSINSVNNIESGVSCTLEIESALPFLRKTYGDKMHKVLHVGPSTCSVVSKLLEEVETEAWGIEPYELEDVDSNCKGLISKGIVRVVDIKFPLPYQSKSFSLVVVSDALDYMSPKYLNKTLPELARVSKDGIVVFNGYPGIQKVKVAELSKFGRPAKMRSSSWWIRYFIQTGLKEDESASKKFQQAAKKNSYKPACQIFHLRSHH
ncbi:probable pectin methylesterase CGR3 [Impatiens glandulifera]|uniref:probable pectin methylesterase CGR3 n=1 Tax=Impatiens glandulifera TaxID=253017 RepID=UPI001FB07679|nr:probable pectin methylesterase CGR3 [Impatiens glandulifera]